MKLEKLPPILIILLILFLAFSRIISLDADPTMFKRIGDISDEGYWFAEARNKVLFDEWVADDKLDGLAFAPLYSFLAFLSFKFNGVSLFAGRLVSAMAGFLSIFLLYFIVKRYDEKLAVVSALILALNSAFFMYNRIGHTENLVIFNILLTFFFLTVQKRSNIHYFLSGICFSLAVLSKITAAYFSIVIFIYLTALYLKKDADLVNILFFLTGFLPVIFIAIFFYFIPNYPILEPIISFHSFRHPRVLIFPFVYFPYNYYLSLPSIYLLLILSIIYFKERNIITFFSNIKQNIKSLNEIELMAFSWFFGYSIALLFSHFSDRRFTLLVIPLVLFSSMAIVNRKTDKFEYKGRINLFTFFILMLPPIIILSLFIRKLILITGIRDYNEIILLLLTFLSVIIYVIINKKLFYKNIIDKYLPKLSILCLLLALSLNFILRNSQIIEFLTIPIPKIFIYLISTMLAVILFLGLTRDIFLLKKITSRAYIIFCAFMLIYSLFLPSFTVKNSSIEISKITNPGEWIIGGLAHELSFENNLRPIWWIPNVKNRNSEINEWAVEKYQPKYYIKLVSYMGQKKGHNKFRPTLWPSPEDVNGSLVYLDTFELWPVFGKPRTTVEFYRIESNLENMQ